MGVEVGALTDGSVRALSDDAIARRISGAIDAEAKRAVEAGVATADDIAVALRLGAGHPDRDGSAIR